MCRFEQIQYLHMLTESPNTYSVHAAEKNNWGNEHNVHAECDVLM